ncbi:4341_t:CDS:2, partial [Acaulospora colombiana]
EILELCHARCGSLPDFYPSQKYYLASSTMPSYRSSILVRRRRGRCPGRFTSVRIAVCSSGNLAPGQHTDTSNGQTPTPTATQFTTSLSTSYSTRTELTTEWVTVTSDFFLRARQDPNNPTPGDSSVSSSSSSSTDGGFGVNDITSIIRTLTFTDAFVVTNTIPQVTLYAPCTTSISSVSSPTNTQSISNDPDRANNSNSTAEGPTSFDEDGKMTTVSEGVTIVVSEYVTTINGVATITATPIQTLLNTSDGTLSHSQRTGVIAGAAVGGMLVLIALLGAEEKQRRLPRRLLEDEADDFDLPAPMTQWDGTSLTTSSSASAPRLLRARGSQTGSLFHENVWPPPTEVMQDPLVTSHDLGSSISLAMGLPVEMSSPQQMHPGVAFTSAEPIGAVGRQQRSSGYESVRSMDSFDYGRAHSRAESAEPLLENTARNISPPPLMLHTSPPASEA